MLRNPHLDLYAMARRLNDWRAVNSATLARDLWTAGSRQAAASHATMARKRMRELATPDDVSALAHLYAAFDSVE